MIRALIVDDEPPARDQVREFLSVRIHRSLIVNLDCIKELRSNKRGGYTLVTAGGHRLAAGATYVSSVQALLAK